MTTLKKRARWAISYVSETRELSNTKIGKRLGVKSDTVNSYRSMSTNPKVDFIVRFCDAFGFDLLWFAKGVGEPFSGARELYPDVCGEPIDPGVLTEGKGKEYDMDVKEAPSPVRSVDHLKEYGADPFSKAKGLLEGILSSGDLLFTQALMSHLIALDNAIQKAQRQSDEIKELKKECEALKRRIAALEAKLRAKAE